MVETAIEYFVLIVKLWSRPICVFIDVCVVLMLKFLFCCLSVSATALVFSVKAKFSV